MLETAFFQNAPRCGVVILNYNSHDLTVALARTIARYNSVSDVCVVDNCSNDDFDGDFQDSKIYYIKNTNNAGYSAGNNVGLRYLVNERNCEFVFIANPDVTFDDNTIIEIYKKMLDYPDLMLVSTKRYGYKGETVHQYFDFPSILGSIKNCFFITRRGAEKKKIEIQNYEVDHANGIFIVDAVPGAFFGIRSSFLVENNFIYEGIFLYGEEIILGRQARECGYKAGIINSEHYYHNHIRKGFSNRKMFWYDRCSLRRYYKMFGLLKWYQMLGLDIAIVLGSTEYNCAYYLYNIMKKIKR